MAQGRRLHKDHCAILHMCADVVSVCIALPESVAIRKSVEFQFDGCQPHNSIARTRRPAQHCRDRQEASRQAKTFTMTSHAARYPAVPVERGSFTPIAVDDNPKCWKGDIGLLNSSSTNVVFSIDSLVGFLKTLQVEVDSNLTGARSRLSIPFCWMNGQRLTLCYATRIQEPAQIRGIRQSGAAPA